MTDYGKRRDEDEDDANLTLCRLWVGGGKFWTASYCDSPVTRSQGLVPSGPRTVPGTRSAEQQQTEDGQTKRWTSDTVLVHTSTVL
jgi:hypothetical protein